MNTKEKEFDEEAELRNFLREYYPTLPKPHVILKWIQEHYITKADGEAMKREFLGQQIIQDFVHSTEDWHDQLMDKDKDCLFCGVRPSKMAELAKVLTPNSSTDKDEPYVPAINR